MKTMNRYFPKMPMAKKSGPILGSLGFTMKRLLLTTLI